MKTPITLKQYYKSFLSLSGVFATLPPLYASILSLYIPGRSSDLGFPPIGSVESFARLGLLLLSLAVIHVSYFLSPKTWRLAACFAVALVGLVTYVAMYPRLVVRIDIPRVDTVRVCVGGERTGFALSNFPNYSDEDMLRARGTSEEEVRKLWTPRSLAWARVALILTYSMFILGVVSVFSLGVRRDLLQQQSSAPTHPSSEKRAAITS